MNAPIPSDTSKKQREYFGGHRFKKGDPRINRKGRPKSFDQLRSLAQDLAHKEGKGRYKGQTLITAIMMDWACSRDPVKQKAFVEYAFGKVADKVETSSTEKKTFILVYDHENKPAAAQAQTVPERNGHLQLTNGEH